jgi:hypothetical protein
MLTAGAAHAQVRNLNMTEMNSQFATGTSSSTFGQSWNAKMPTMDESVNGQRIMMGMFDTKMSALNGMQSSPQWSTPFSNNHMMETKMMDQPQMQEPTMDRYNGQLSSLSHYSDYGEWQRPGGVPRISDAYVLHSGEYTPSDQNTSQELSLQDINRYDFRASRSSEPGLPVTHAGGGGEDSSGGSLVNTPALFDFGNGKGLSAPTSQVHSGGAVAPSMITPSGEVKSVESTHQDVSSMPAPAPEPAPAPAPGGSEVVPGSAPGPIPNMDVNHNYAPMDPSRANEVQLGQPQVWVRVEDN